MYFSLYNYLLLSAVLFSIGVIGVLVRRNALVVFMCIELMLNGANLALVAFSRFLGLVDSQVFVFFVMVVTASEVAVGLAILIAFFRIKGTADVDAANLLKW